MGAAVRRALAAARERLDVLRQLKLLDESAFLAFAKKRGVDVRGIISGEPGRLHAAGWLPADDVDEGGNPRFHPFRICPLRRIVRASRLAMRVTRASTGEAAARLASELIAALPSDERLAEMADSWNELAELAIVLEPLYWPQLVGWRRGSASISWEEYDALRDEHRRSCLTLVRSLDEDSWRERHRDLLVEAEMVDANTELYALLRLSSWERREKLEGDVALALWLRHIAEVVRRGFEEAHSVVWPEEDQGTGLWRASVRRRRFATERPFDEVVPARQQLARHFGLRTGSVLRWYVEGDTEYDFIRYFLLDPPALGISLHNLHGQIARDKGDALEKLGNMLQEDLEFRRLSMLSFDMDEPNNCKAVRMQIERGRIVGSLQPSDPDFEFANFSLEELVEIAARLDEDGGVCGDCLRGADWSGCCGMPRFEQRWRAASARGARRLKERGWAVALATYADEHPARADSQEERPALRALRMAMRARDCNYEVEKRLSRFDARTFARLEVSPGEHEGVVKVASCRAPLD